MKQPTNSQIDEIKELLSICIEELVVQDSDIFNIELDESPQISPLTRILNRELHETTINHRLAYYIERNIKDDDLSFHENLSHYKVDIEYNRFYNNPKILRGISGSVRPDILVHTRLDNTVDQQHYLVVEAKKAQIIPQDINKIRRFIRDDNYNYLFGLTISYCRDPNFILGNLFYFNGIRIINEPVTIPKA